MGIYSIYRKALAAAALFIPLVALATPIEIEALTSGEHPASLGGYALTPFDAPDDGMHSCTESHTGEDLCFEDYYGDSVELLANDPYWWEYDGVSGSPDHGNVFVVHNENWIDLILPPNTRALALFVGASDRGRAWIQAHDEAGNSTSRVHFGINENDTRGYGIYSTGCAALTRVTVEPWEWGFGFLASNEGECRSVPEPGSLWLFGIGLLGLGLAHRFRRKTARIR